MQHLSDSSDHPDSGLPNIADFLSSSLVSSLFKSHPNDLGTSSFRPPAQWSDWWDWAGANPDEQADEAHRVDPWLLLLQYYDWHRESLEDKNGQPPSDSANSIPHSLRNLVEDACRLAIPREAGRVVFHPFQNRPSSAQHFATSERRHCMANNSSTPLPGMSPKKAHEVVQMTDFIGNVLQSDPSLACLKHVVDVGAGQAYLSRILRDHFGFHVLALDFSDVQTQGAAKRDATKPKRKAPANASPTAHAPAGPPQGSGGTPEPHRGSLTYVTTKIDADTLHDCTNAWIEQRCSLEASDASGEPPTPVLFVALHACGSLTPDILRAFAAAATRHADATRASPRWTPQAAVLVGCCYNMLRPEDFPLSHQLKSISRPGFTFNPSHLQLAAQVPSQWTHTASTLSSARLALRKIVYRALIQPVLDDERTQSAQKTDQALPSPAPDNRPSARRLGRLNDAAYADWATFAQRVQTKLGLPDGQRLVHADRALERRIEVFHVLRCIVGPVVESLLLLDRALWVQEALQDTGLGVELVNLFDQASGSGRNVAIVIRPYHDAGENGHGDAHSHDRS